MSSPTPTGTGKICVVCGVDCANKPRSKDNKGRYYCQPCYDKAHDAPKAKKISAHANANAMGVDEPGPLNLLDQLIDSAPPIVNSVACASCGFAMASGAVICTNCGYNTQTHHAVRAPKVAKQHTQASGGTIWPSIVGIVSIVFGGGGVLINGGVALMRLFQSLSSGEVPIALIAASTLTTSLSAWLLRDGIRILRQDSGGVTWIRGWAVVKLAVYGGCLGLVLATMSDSQLDRALGAFSDQSRTTVDSSDVRNALGMLLAWFAFWPAFVLVFFFIPRIRRDVATWD